MSEVTQAVQAVPLGRRIRRFMSDYPIVPLIVLLIVLIVILQFLRPGIVNERWIANTIKFSIPLAILASCQTLTMLTGGIDLSVGAIMVLSSVVMGQFTFRYGLPPAFAILCGFAVGGFCGWINGVLVAYMKLPPFIVTLGTWQVYNATKYLYSKNETIRGQDIEAQAPLLQLFGIQIRFGGAVITLGVIFMVLLVVFLWYVLNYTAWGRRVYAVGDDP